MMNRKQKVYLNATISIFYKIVSIICAFILPRAILTAYGSEVNGLTQSIAQFLSFISLLDCGVTSVIDANLYGPLAKRDHEKINAIFISSKRFYRKIAYIFLAYIAVLMAFYPLSVSKSFDFWFSSLLIFIIAISTFSQYYFGISYRVLLNADQLGFIVIIIQCIALVLNTIISVLLIKLGCSIHLVKLSASILYLLQPLCLKIYVDRRYHIDYKMKLTYEPIKQKWNGLTQHIAFIIATKADTIILTIFSTLKAVSVYAVYNLVLSGITSIFDAITSGINSFIGNMLANKEDEKLNRFINVYEWVSHTAVTLLFTIAGILIVPFVQVYTNGLPDTKDYIEPLFAVLITAANAAHMLRMPYKSVVMAAGHFKQTQLSAIIEAALNVVISVVAVFEFGLIGVAVGTLIAMAYRTVYFVVYLSRNILNRSISYFIKNTVIDIVSIILIVFTTKPFITETLTYSSWVILAIKVGSIALIECILINIIFYHKNIKEVYHIVKNKGAK